MTCPLPDHSPTVQMLERREGTGYLPYPRIDGPPSCLTEFPSARVSSRSGLLPGMSIGSSSPTSLGMSDPRQSRGRFVSRLTASSPDRQPLSPTSSRRTLESPGLNSSWEQDQYNETILETGTEYGSSPGQDSSSPYLQGKFY